MLRTFTISILILSLSACISKPPNLTHANSWQMPCKCGRIVAGVKTNKMEVALTIDDGPSTQTLQNIKDLQTAHAVATFFFIANRMVDPMDKVLPEVQEIINEAYMQGDEIGVHSYSHRLLSHNRVDGTYQIPGDVNAAEQPKALAVFKQVLGFVPYAYRAPGFKYSKQLIKTVADSGQCLIDINMKRQFVDSNADKFTGKAAERKLAEFDHGIADNLRPGQIILAHNDAVRLPEDGGGKHLRQAGSKHIKNLIKLIQAHGYKLVTIGQLLRDGKPIYVVRCN